MSIKIFTEGGGLIGYGHLTRCCIIYDQTVAMGINTVIVIAGMKIAPEIIGHRRVRYCQWYREDSEEITIESHDYCIIDSYKAGDKFYKSIAWKCKRVVYIDDYCRLNYPPGIIVNPSPNISNLNYSHSGKKRLYFGMSYVLLREPFINSGKGNLKAEINNILLTLGGSDPVQLYARILPLIRDIYPAININVMGGESLATNLEVGSSTRIHVNLGSKSVRELMLQADIVITACGQTLYELMALKVPFLGLTIADNQRNNADYLRDILLENQVLDVYEEQFDKKFSAKMNQLIKLAHRQDTVLKYPDTLDGKGEQWIVSLLFQEDYYLRKVLEKDRMAIYNLSNSEYVRRHSIKKEKISLETHQKWFDKIVNDRNTVFYVISDKTGACYGQIRYTVSDNNGVISMSLGSELIGRGKSKGLLSASINELKYEPIEVNRITAFVSKDNQASMKLFEGTGFGYVTCEAGLIRYEKGVNHEN